FLSGYIATLRHYESPAACAKSPLTWCRAVAPCRRFCTPPGALVSRARFVTALTLSINHCVRARLQHRCHMTEMLKLHSWWNAIRRSDSATESRRSRMIVGAATRWRHHDGCRDPDAPSDRTRRLAGGSQRSRAHTGGALEAPAWFRRDGFVLDAGGLSLLSSSDLSGPALCAAKPARDCAPHRASKP